MLATMEDAVTWAEKEAVTWPEKEVVTVEHPVLAIFPELIFACGLLSSSLLFSLVVEDWILVEKRKVF